MFEIEPSGRFKRDEEPLKPLEITKFFERVDPSKKNVFVSVGWTHKHTITGTDNEISEIMSEVRLSLGTRLSSLEDNKCLILPYNYRLKKHVAGIMFCNSPQKKVYVFDTGGDDKREAKKEEIKSFLKKKNLEGYNVDDDSFVFGTIQGKCGCGFHVVNEAEVFKELGFTTDVILQKAQTGELQFLVMSKSSGMMQSQTGNIQIIKNSGVAEGTGANVIIQEGYMEFNLGDSRFKMSLSNDKAITTNKYISRKGLLKSIKSKELLKEINSKLSELRDIPKAITDGITEKIKELERLGASRQSPRLTTKHSVAGTIVTPYQEVPLPPLNQLQRQTPQGRMNGTTNHSSNNLSALRGITTQHFRPLNQSRRQATFSRQQQLQQPTRPKKLLKPTLLKKGGVGRTGI